MARPSKYETHVAPRLTEVSDWVRNGASDREVAERLGIAESTLNDYKKQFSEFSECLKKTRARVDGEVENALLKRALGYDVDEVTQEIYTDGSKHVKKVQRHIPPDTTAMIFWLKNRRPEKWRDVNAVDATITEKNPLAGLTEKELRALANDTAKTTDSS